MDDIEYRFVFVRFEYGTKEYSYLCEDETLDVDTLVIVPAGRANSERTAKIVSVQYSNAENAPYPIDRIKSVIRAANADEVARFTDLFEGEIISDEFDPLDKFEELWEYFSFINQTYKCDDTKANEGKIELIISLNNDRSNRNLSIRIDSEFRLCFREWDTPFGADEQSYREMISIIMGIIANNLCVLEIISGDFLLGYMLVQKNRLEKDIFHDIIQPSILYKKFKDKIKDDSFSVNAYFWDRKFDRKFIIK